MFHHSNSGRDPVSIKTLLPDLSDYQVRDADARAQRHSSIARKIYREARRDPECRAQRVLDLTERRNQSRIQERSPDRSLAITALPP